MYLVHIKKILNNFKRHVTKSLILKSESWSIKIIINSETLL